MNLVSFDLDNFILDKDETIWIVELSDGRRVYQDDYRPGLKEPIAWKRLREFCQINELGPVKIWIKFRSHTEYAGESSEGLFFRRGILANSASSQNIHFYLTGLIDGGMIHVTKWQVPEILVDTVEDRHIEGNEDGIIWNHKNKDNI